MDQKSVEERTVIDAEKKVSNVESLHGASGREEDVCIRGCSVCPDNVEIALHEFSVSAALGVFSAPYFCNMVSSERQVELFDMFRHKACERHR